MQYGTLKGILTALHIPFELIRPVDWQRALGCMTKGDKNISKTKAQQLFPDIKVTHAKADALLIAEHCRRMRNQGSKAIRIGQSGHIEGRSLDDQG